MKRILLILCLIVSFTGSAQILTPEITYGREVRRLLVNTSLGFPIDTFSVPINYPTQAWTAMKAGVLYTWNGTIWVAVSSGGSSGWSLSGNSISKGVDRIGTTNDADMRFITNNVETMVLDSLAGRMFLRNGANPLLSMKQTTSDQEWQLRVGIGTGSAKSGFNIYDVGTGKINMYLTNNQVAIGNVSTIPGVSQLYVYGGTTGGNIDARGDSTVIDEANIEAENAGYDGVFHTGYGVAMQVNGNNATGYIDGHPKKNMGQLRFTNSTNLIRVVNNRSLRFSINGSERMVLDSNGRVGIGTASPGYLLDVQANTAGSFASQIYNSNADGAGLGVKVNNSVVDRTIFSVGSGTSGSTIRFEVTADGKILVPALTNLTTQDRLVGVLNSSGRLGNVTIGTGLSLASGVLSNSGITSTPTLQQTLTAGSVLNQDNTIDGGGNSFLLTNFLDFELFSASNSVLLDARDFSLDSSHSAVGINRGSVTIEASSGLSPGNNTHTSGSEYFVDSIFFFPYKGRINIDTIRSGAATDSIMTWNEATGAVGKRPMPSGGTITGADTRVLFFDGVNNPAGDAGLTYNKTTDALSIAGDLINPDYTISGLGGATRAKVGGVWQWYNPGVSDAVHSWYKNDGSDGITLTSTSMALNSITGTGDFSIQTGAGELGIGTGTATAKLHVFGTFKTSGVNTLADLAGSGSRAVLSDASGVLSAPVSDRSVKNNIKDVNGAIGKIMKLRPVNFEYKDGWKNYGTGTQIGFIAQDIAKVLPNSTFITPTTGKMGYNEIDLLPLTISALQEAIKRIQQLEKEVTRLKKKK